MIFGSAGGFFLTNILLTKIYTLHIEISILPVFLCGLFIFLVGISTTSGTIFKAATAGETGDEIIEAGEPPRPGAGTPWGPRPTAR